MWSSQRLQVSIPNQSLNWPFSQTAHPVPFSISPGEQVQDEATDSRGWKVASHSQGLVVFPEAFWY